MKDDYIVDVEWTVWELGQVVKLLDKIDILNLEDIDGELYPIEDLKDTVLMLQKHIENTERHKKGIKSKMLKWFIEGGIVGGLLALAIVCLPPQLGKQVVGAVLGMSLGSILVFIHYLLHTWWEKSKEWVK